MANKQTAVEWYNDEMDQLVSMLITNQLSISRYNELQNKLLEQAKAMEREQIIEAHKSGQHYADNFEVPHSEEAEDYYNETFKPE